jgi:hypothetical protein
MAIDPNIALGVRGIEIANPLAQYSQVAQIQNAQNQNALAQFQLGSAQRQEVSQNALNEAYAQNTDPKTGEVNFAGVRNYLAGKGAGSQIPGQLKLEREAESAKLTQQKAQTELVDAKLKQSRSFLDTINPADPQAPAQYLAWHQANHADPVLGPALKARGVTAEQSLARIQQAIQAGPQAFAELINQSKLGTEKFMELNKPQFITENLGGTSKISALPGLGGAPTVVSETTKTATAGEKLVDARAKENIAISREKLKRDSDPAFQQQMAAAKATGEAIAKNDVAAKQALPSIITNAQTALDVVDQMVGKQEVRDKNGKLIQAATKPHPGFENAVGATWVPGARFVPGTDAAGFQALQDQIEGTAFLSAFEALKGGGAISEKEGAKATAARLRMTLAQDEKEYVKAAREFQDIVRTGVQNAQRKVGGGAASPSPTNAANIDALLKKYE